MQRRSFLTSLFCAGASAGALASTPQFDFKTGFNTCGLRPAEFKRRWIEAVKAQRALGQRGQANWRYAPTGEQEPFMAWYPGDEWVDTWTLDNAALGTAAHPMVRSFEHEARLRGRTVSAA